MASDSPLRRDQTKPTSVPMAKVIAANCNGGTVPTAAVSAASPAHNRTASRPSPVALRVPGRAIASSRGHVLAAVGVEACARDEARVIGGQEDDAARDLGSCAEPADWNHRQDLRLEYVLGNG